MKTDSWAHQVSGSMSLSSEALFRDAYGELAFLSCQQVLHDSPSQRRSEVLDFMTRFNLLAGPAVWQNSPLAAS